MLDMHGFDVSDFIDPSDLSEESVSGLIHFCGFGYFPASRCDCDCCEYWTCDGCSRGWACSGQAVDECYDDLAKKICCCFCPDFFPDTLRFRWRPDDRVLEVRFDV